MKKFLRVFVTVLALFALCGNVFASPSDPTEQEALDAWQQAYKVFNLFDMHPLPTDGRGKKQVGYMIYYNVSDPNIKTMSALRSKMNTVFTSELTNRILTTSRTYIDNGGYLYVAPAGRGTNIYAGKTTFKVIKEAPDKMTIQTITEILEDPRHNKMNVIKYDTKDFTYVKTLSGWRFANFTRIK